MKRSLIIFILMSFLFSCEKTGNIPVFDNMDVTSGFVLNNSIILGLKECAGDMQSHTFICLDSITGDSRCPEGVECIWAGNAQARFKFTDKNSGPVFFNLNTNPSFTKDTVVGGYKFSLVAIYPYPGSNDIILNRKYRAEIEIEKELK